MGGQWVSWAARRVTATLQEYGWADDRLAGFLDALERTYKAPFPATDEDTLAGGLSNTIAGRICNYFDLKGGGYTVDGACSSSLLSVATACRALIDGELDVEGERYRRQLAIYCQALVALQGGAARGILMRV